MEKGLILHAICKKDSVFAPIQSVKAFGSVRLLIKPEWACNEDFINIVVIDVVGLIVVIEVVLEFVFVSVKSSKLKSN